MNKAELKAVNLLRLRGKLVKEMEALSAKWKDLEERGLWFGDRAFDELNELMKFLSDDIDQIEKRLFKIELN